MCKDKVTFSFSAAVWLQKITVKNISKFITTVPTVYNKAKFKGHI